MLACTWSPLLLRPVITECCLDLKVTVIDRQWCELELKSTSQGIQVSVCYQVMSGGWVHEYQPEVRGRGVLLNALFYGGRPTFGVQSKFLHFPFFPPIRWYLFPHCVAWDWRRGDVGNVKNCLPTLFNASFLIIVLQLGTVISHLVSLALVKIFFMYE